jgi:hypothetical protein
VVPTAEALVRVKLPAVVTGGVTGGVTTGGTTATAVALVPPPPQPASVAHAIKRTGRQFRLKRGFTGRLLMWCGGGKLFTVLCILGVSVRLKMTSLSCDVPSLPTLLEVIAKN